jgi:Glu-tRNA(Gln) amidotransferase subunit E-like FAD-binding protein
MNFQFQNMLNFLRKLYNEWKVDPTTAAVFLIQYPKRLQKNGCMLEWMNEELFEKVLKVYSDGKIPKDALYQTIKKRC